MSDHQDTILYGLKSGAAAAKTPGERLLLTKAADEIASLRSRLERAREKVSMSKDSFTKIMEATKSGDHGDQIIARHCEAMLRELENGGGDD